MFDWFVIETIPLLNVVGPRIWSVFVLVQKQAVIAFVKDTFLAPYIRRPRPPFFDYFQSFKPILINSSSNNPPSAGISFVLSIARCFETSCVRTICSMKDQDRPWTLCERRAIIFACIKELMSISQGTLSWRDHSGCKIFFTTLIVIAIQVASGCTPYSLHRLLS